MCSFRWDIHMIPASMHTSINVSQHHNLLRVLNNAGDTWPAAWRKWRTIQGVLPRVLRAFSCTEKLFLKCRGSEMLFIYSFGGVCYKINLWMELFLIWFSLIKGWTRRCTHQEKQLPFILMLRTIPMLTLIHLLLR